MVQWAYVHYGDYFFSLKENYIVMFCFRVFEMKLFVWDYDEEIKIKNISALVWSKYWENNKGRIRDKVMYYR